MTRWTWMLALALGGTSFALTSAARADDENEQNEKVVSLDQVPAPARTTILRQAAGAPILKVEQETERGKTVYEAHVNKGGEEIGITVNPDGTLVGTHPEKSEKNENKRQKH